MQKVLKNVVWGCLFIVPFIALYISDAGTFDFLHYGSSGLFFPFISGKNLVFRSIVEIAFVAWLLLALNDAKYRIKKSPLVIAYGIFMLIILMADIFGVDTRTSMWSNFERMEGFVGHIHLFAYFVILTSMVSTVEDWGRLLKVFIFSNILVMGWGFLQLLGVKQFFFYKIAPGLSEKIAQAFPVHQSTYQLDSTIGNSSYYAIFCVLFAFIAAILFTQVKDRGQKFFYVAIIVLNLISLFYTSTRGAIIGMMAGSLVTFAVFAYHQKGKVRNLFFATVVVLALAISSIFIFKESSFVKGTPTLAHFSNISFKTGTGFSRMNIWKMSYDGWKKRPILGYGQDNFQYVFPREFIGETMWSNEPWFDRSHNVFFDWLIAGGILGLLSYLSLFAVAAFLLLKRGSEIPFKEKALIAGALVAYFVHNVFVFDNLTSYILFFTLLAYIAVRTGKNHVWGENTRIGEWKDLLQPVIIVSFMAIFYYVNYLPHLTNRLVISGMDVNRLIQTMPFEEILKHQNKVFKEAISIGLLGKQEAEEQFFQIAGRMIQYQIPDTLPQQQKQSIAQAQNEFISSVKAYAKEVEPKYKDNVRMLNIIGMFYNSIGDGVSADEVLSKALAIAPNKQLIMFDLARAKMIQSKFDESYQLSVRAYELAPEYDVAQKFLTITGIYARKFQEVNELLAKNKQTVAVNQDTIGALISSGQKDLAIMMLNTYKQNNPSEAEQVNQLIQKLLAQPAN